MIRPLLAAICLAAPITTAFAAIKAEEDGPIPELRPAYGALEEVREKPRRWPYFVAAGLLTISAVLMWPHFQPRGHEPGETACNRARRELRDLRQPEATAIGRIMREYVFATLPSPGPGQTFAEISTALDRDLRWTPGLRARFRKLADPIEIAKFSPEGSPVALDQLRDEALTLITEVDALSRPPAPAVEMKPA